ncbi:probable imidazolonepropionase [Ostrea edulis]|uniref:probable imidazolonepropionase n=1 Tax=Ostrea edulis TaxID=37623 RepID=UPI0024AFC84A|nr:probable imidazolonepropionase [Ostrea edulis]
MGAYKLLVKGAKQIVTIRNDSDIRVLRGKEMQHVDIIEAEDGDGTCILVDSYGKIEFVGLDSERVARYPSSDDDVDRVIEADGKCIVPGLVDAHTHPVWAGDRVHEFAMKLAGASYMEVHEAGGGIHFTVEHTRKASQDELYVSLNKRLYDMMSTGTTCIECKSGYGLDTESEVKMLKVIETAKREHPLTISSTFCGAHAIPKGSTPVKATEDVIDKQLPTITGLMKDGQLHVDNIDVFCEKGVFDLQQSRAILMAGKAAGMNINFHGDELHPLNGAKMGAELGALAISHLEEISDEGITAMATSGSVGVVLPTTAYILRLKPPPVRKMIEAGMAVALGSDFNPNAYCFAMPTVMHLACVLLRMSMPESLVAATLNAAAALDLSKDYGTLSRGKYADMVIFDAPRWEHLIYQFGCHDKIIEYVIKKGDVAHTKFEWCG